MAPYLDTVKAVADAERELSYSFTAKSFADVPITDAGVDTLAFLDASDGLSRLFDLMGSAAFSPVQKDIRGNIQKIRDRYNAAPALSGTLEQLVENEKGEKKRTATQGLMWLVRGLSFTCKGLKEDKSNKQELSDTFSASYDQTLSKYHSVFVRPIFTLAMKACPYRADLYDKLAADESGGPPASKEKLEGQLGEWLGALDKIVVRIEGFYASGKHDQGF